MSPTTLILDAGWPAYVILALTILAPGPAVLFTVLAAFRLRIPAALWYLAPVLALLAGQGGALWGALQVRQALGYVATDMGPALAAGGVGALLSSTLVAYALSPLAWLPVAVLGAIPHVARAGEKARWTPGHAVGPVVLGFFAAVAAVVGAYASHSGPLAYAVAPTALVGSLFTGIACLRMGEEERDAARLAAARGLVSVAVVGAVLGLVAANRVAGEVQVFHAIAMAAPETKQAMLAEGLRQARTPALWPSVILVGGASLAAVAPVARHLDLRAGVGAAVAALVLAIPVVGAAGLRLTLSSLLALASGGVP